MIVTTYSRLIREDHQTSCAAAFGRLGSGLVRDPRAFETNQRIDAFDGAGTRRGYAQDQLAPANPAGMKTGKVSHAA